MAQFTSNYESDKKTQSNNNAAKDIYKCKRNKEWKKRDQSKTMKRTIIEWNDNERELNKRINEKGKINKEKVMIKLHTRLNGLTL